MNLSSFHLTLQLRDPGAESLQLFEQCHFARLERGTEAGVHDGARSHGVPRGRAIVRRVRRVRHLGAAG